MARGNDQKSRIKTPSTIVFQDEEHGLGYRAALDLSVDHGRPSRRLTTADTLSALLTEKATKAVVPYQNDRGGFNEQTLSTLLDFKDFVIEGENIQQDNYCLAAPAASIHEIAQAAFPGTYDGKAAVGPFPRDRQLQNSFRKRVEVVYATNDAFERCASTIDELRASGVEVRKLEEGKDPYREVLTLARSELDPNRKIRTQSNDSNAHVMISDTSASAYSKSLKAVLLPQDVAVGSPSEFNPATGMGHGAEFNGDYVILDDHLADQESNIETRFLVLSKKHEKKLSAGSPPPKPVTAQAGLMKKIDQAIKDYSGFSASEKAEQSKRFFRILLKLDTRGGKTADISDIMQDLTKAGIHHQPVYIHDRPDTLPVILEIQLDLDQDANSTGLHSAVKSGLCAALEKATAKPRNHATRMLGAFATTTDSFANVEKPFIAKDNKLVGVIIGLLILGLIGFGLYSQWPTINELISSVS